MATGDDEHWVADLDEEARRRTDQSSFHLFAEGRHSDARGQVYNLRAGASLALPYDRWPNHVFLVLGVLGQVRAALPTTEITVRPLSQLVVLPGIACTLSAISDASIELVSFLSMRPQPLRNSRDVTGASVRITAAANVLVPAIRTLELRGFTVTRERSTTVDLWRAHCPPFEVIGDNPLDLLALIALLDARGANWQASDEEIADVMQRFELESS